MASPPSTPKADWEVKTLGDLTEVVTKGTTPTSVGYKFTEQGIAFVKVESITPEGNFLGGKLARINEDCHNALKRSQLKAGDILFSIAGALGRTAIVSNEILPANTNQALAIIRLKPSDDVSLRFIEKALSTGFVLDQVEKLKGGVAQQNLSLSQVKSFRIPLPPLAEQERIVGILDEAFEGIAAATAQAEKNLHNARELFQSVLQSTFSQKGDDWVETEIGDFAEVFDGPHATPKTVESGPVFLGIAALQDGALVLGKTRHVTPDDYVKWTRRVTPQADDVVFSYETRLGQAAIIPEGLECCLGRRMGLVRLERQRMMSRFFVFQYVSPPFREYLDSKTIRGATVDRIPLKEFPSFKILVPPLPTQQAIVEKLDALSEETKALEAIYERKQSALAELKQSLLQKAFAGEL